MTLNGTILAVTLSLSINASALELELPNVFGDHMVLQRGQSVPVWGTADAGARVVVEFAGQSASTAADARGAWRVDLKAMEASAESRALKVTASMADESKTLDYSDVLVGEVWLCGGQSNMYRPFRMLVGPAVDPVYEPVAAFLRDEAASANDPLFRQYRVGPDFSVSQEQTKGRGKWSKAVAGDVNEFSGTGYFFGRELRRELNVPVALLSCNLGGTRIEPWIPPSAFAKDTALKDYYGHQLAAHEKQVAEWDNIKAKGKNQKAGSRKPESPTRDKQVPGTLYNAMVRPLVPYGIKGAIWYQGESNSGHFPEAYGARFASLIDGWRTAWGQKVFPFYWCQLANYKKANDTPVGDEDTWALVQDGQRSALTLPDTGMAVLNDIGEARDVHPKNKLETGRRLSLWALKQTYGRNVVCSGPLFKDARVAGKQVMITFDHAGTGLMVGRKHLMEPTVEIHEPLKRFQIRGSDGAWKWADAKIVGLDTVAVWNDEIQHPVEVRYAWSTNPEGANLYNREGLPASLFKTMNFQLNR